MLAAELGGPVERLWLEKSFHVATLDYDRAEVEAATVAFAGGSPPAERARVRSATGHTGRLVAWTPMTPTLDHDRDASPWTSMRPSTSTGPELDAHRRELTGYCYRMLGLGLRGRGRRAGDPGPGVEGHRPLRGPLVGAVLALPDRHQRLRRHAPRPAAPGPPDGPRPVVHGRRPRCSRPQAENTFVQPIADERVIADDGDPADVAAARESIRLAFVAALQHLPARQRAVLILCEVLRWQATEVAELLDTSVASVNSALQRARATLGALRGRRSSTPPLDPEHEALLARYVDAFERYDMTALAALLRDDVVISMPPHDLWLQGPDNVVGWMVGPGPRLRGLEAAARCRPTAPPASAATSRPRPGRWEPWALQVIEVRGGRHLRPPQLPLPGAVRRVRPPAVPRGLTAPERRSVSRGTCRRGGPMQPSAGAVSGHVHVRSAPTRSPAGGRSSRWLLVIPHLLVLYVVQIVASVCAFIAWFAILFTGKLPDGPGRRARDVVRYQARVTTFALFLREEYPPFSFDTTAADPGDDPRVRVDVVPQLTDRNRVTVFFRYFMVIPHAFVLAFVGIGAGFALLVAAVGGAGHRRVAGGHPGLRARLRAVDRPAVAATPCCSPTSTRRSPSTDPSLHQLGREADQLDQLAQVRPHLAQLDRPPEPAGRELHAQQALDEPEVAPIRARRRARAGPPRPSRRSTTTARGARRPRPSPA